MRRLSVVAVMLGLVGCVATSGGGGGGDADADVDGDTDVDTDVDSDADTDADTDADRCGDGVLDPGEACDAGGVADARCGANCTVTCAASEVLDPSSGHCYRTNGSVHYWSTGRSQCQDLGPGFDLVAPTSQDEIAFLHSALDLADSWAYWTAGKTILGANEFKWMTGETWTFDPPAAPWQPGEPDETPSDPYDDWCVALRTDADRAAPWLVLEDFTCGGADTICEWTPPGTVRTPEQEFLDGLEGTWHGSIGADYAGGCLCLRMQDGGAVEGTSGIAFSGSAMDVPLGDVLDFDVPSREVDLVIEVDTGVTQDHWHVRGTVGADFDGIDGVWEGVEESFWDDAITLDREPATCQERTGTGGTC